MLMECEPSFGRMQYAVNFCLHLSVTDIIQIRLQIKASYWTQLQNITESSIKYNKQFIPFS
jgi:hypothetical protein